MVSQQHKETDKNPKLKDLWEVSLETRERVAKLEGKVSVVITLSVVTTTAVLGLAAIILRALLSTP